MLHCWASNKFAARMPGERSISNEALVLGRRLHYVSRGAGPAVLLIHGMGAASHAWDRIELEGHRLIAVDLPGCGRSELVSGLQAPNDLAYLLQELMGGLGHRSYSVVGHSLGALVGLELALLRAESVRAAVLVNPAIRVSPAARLCRVPVAAAAAAAALEALPLPRALIRLYLQALFADRRRVTEAAVEAYARTASTPHYLRVQLAQLRGLFSWSPGDRIRSLRAPTLVVWGARDPFLPLPLGERFARSLPGARFVAIPGCGHAPAEECPGELCAAIVPFLAGCASLRAART